MLAFMLQGLGFRYFNAFRASLAGNRHVVFPVDLMGVKQQLVLPGLGVVKNRHFTISDNDEFLIFKWVQPGYKNVRLESGRKFKMRCCDICDFLMQIISTGGENTLGIFTGQGQNHGNIMGCKRPEDIFFTPDFSQIEPMRINVINPTQLAGTGHFFQTHKYRVVLQKVSHHQGSIFFSSQRD